MKKTPIKVECVFDESGRNAREIVLDSFRLYLQGQLEKKVPDRWEGRGER